MARYNKQVTIIAGTPFNVVTGMTSAQMLAAGYGVTGIPKTPVKEILMQMMAGGTGLGYVMTGIRGQTSPTQQWRVPSAAAATDLSGELAPATASAPGGTWSDPLAGIDTIWADQIWVDGQTSGDIIIISFDTKNG